jgi:hypothetical protein
MMNKHIGVRYVYEDPNQRDSSITDSREHNVLTPAAIAALPVEWLASLEQAILDVNLKLTFTLIEQIRSRDAELANALKSCMDNFEYDKILSLIAESENS